MLSATIAVQGAARRSAWRIASTHEAADDHEVEHDHVAAIVARFADDAVDVVRLRDHLEVRLVAEHLQQRIAQGARSGGEYDAHGTRERLRRGEHRLSVDHRANRPLRTISAQAWKPDGGGSGKPRAGPSDRQERPGIFHVGAAAGPRGGCPEPGSDISVVRCTRRLRIARAWLLSPRRGRLPARGRS